jgi:hypothetical protein
MQKIIGWIKNNKLSSILVAIIFIFIFKSFFLGGGRFAVVPQYDSFSSINGKTGLSTPMFGGMRKPTYFNEAAPQPQVWRP